MPLLQLLILMSLSLAATGARAQGEPDVPDVREVREKALRYANLHRAPDRWSARSRWRNLVPEITATVGWIDETDEGTAFNEYLTRGSGGELLFDTARTTNDSTQKFRVHYSVRAMIDFRGLVFDRHELAAAREARDQAEHRRELVALVHDAYFERMALLEALRADRTPDPARARRLQMLDARLDGLTGGWFTTQLSAKEAQ